MRESNYYCGLHEIPSLGLPADCERGTPLQVGCKALVFPKQFKTQQYYNILKHICPELGKAQPGALKSQR